MSTNTFRDQVRELRHLATWARPWPKEPKGPVVKPVVLAVGDTLRANGCLYRVRKVTPKDFIIRLIGVETRPGVEVPRGEG